jgi:flagellar basal body-associated protein FliL
VSGNQEQGQTDHRHTPILCIIIIIIIIIIIMTHCARTAPSAWVWRLAAEGSSPPCLNVFHVETH